MAYWLPRLRTILALRRAPWCALAIGTILLIVLRDRGSRPGEAVAAAPKTAIAESAAATDRSPVDLVLTEDERFLVTVNQTSNSVSLVDVAAGRVVAELPCGEHPAAVATVPGSNRLLVSCMHAGTVEVLEVRESGTTANGRVTARLVKIGSIDVGMHPYGLAVTADGRAAYVSLSAAALVAKIDLAAMKIAGTIDVGRWPRQMALSPDGAKLAVSTSGDQTVSIVELAASKLAFQHRTGGGLNIGQLQIDRAGAYVYFPWIVYRQFAVTPGNIRLGWVLATRIARGKLDENSYREAISLDVPGLAMGDPHGLALTPNEQWMVCTASGTHELLVYRMADQRFMSVGGPGDLADPKVVGDPRKFYRLPLGGRPMNVRAARDNRRIFVANYLLNCVQTVDLDRREVVSTIELGGPAEPSLARRGQEIFLDARRSLDQWYSCQSCHYEAGPNATVMDTRNDGSDRTFKTVPALYNLPHTGPWTWHGWQRDLGAAMRKSVTETMLGPPPSAEDVAALLAFFAELQPPPNPFAALAAENASAAATVARGRAVFQSDKA
ncbi:MAG TPA: hypothetical protein VHV08_06370, partial [Pirellulales bacterium]|nr:hypothetical protein [Pirellulales bacterium]